MRSAGLLPYRRADEIEVLIAHPGGPFWARRDEGAWSMVKGVVEDGEEERAAAAREFQEETGWQAPPEPWLALGESTMKSGKRLVAWAVEADFDPDTLVPGMFTIQNRGTSQTFPEIDRVGWFPIGVARRKLNPAYGSLLDELERLMAGSG